MHEPEGPVADAFTRNIFVVLGAGGLGLLHSFALLGLSPQARTPTNLFEFFVRAATFGFTIYFYLSWKAITPMHVEHDEIPHSFLNLENLAYEDYEHAIDEFFRVKTHIYAEVQWNENMRIAAYIRTYAQFVQVILYFNVHPRMAVLTSTMMKCLDYMFHFLLLFFVLFLVLAFMSFWMFRESLSGFQDFGTTLESQIRLLCGAFIIADEVEERQGDMHARYWLYALTFLIVAFLTLLNFFPAIVVDAFVMVQELIPSQ